MPKYQKFLRYPSKILSDNTESEALCKVKKAVGLVFLPTKPTANFF
jgi:hypothetical protein